MKWLKLLLFLALFIGIERLCFWETKGFRVHKILSSLEPDPQWESTPLSESERGTIDKLLDQPYFFIGSGGTCYSFVSQDGTTVIKFFKHQHLLPPRWLHTFTLPGGLDYWRIKQILSKEKQLTHKRIPFLFCSCKMSHDLLKEETGIIHLQLNKSPRFSRTLTLYDKIGCKHTIDLGQTEFVLQKRAELVYSLLKQWKKSGETEKAKWCIDHILSLLSTRHVKGIADRDPNIEINFGLAEGKIIEIDIGSFSQASLQRPLIHELRAATEEFSRWLSLHYPELETYLTKQIETYAQPSL